MATFLVWIALVPATAVVFSAATSANDPLALRVLPVAPRPGDTVLVDLVLRNISGALRSYDYHLTLDGRPLGIGTITLEPSAARRMQYAYVWSNQDRQGTQFVAHAVDSATGRESVQSVTVPPYPSQAWSSMSSFSAFSSTLMGSLTSMSYFQSSFGGVGGPNVGLLIALTLIVLLAFLEVASARMHDGAAGRLLAVWTRYRFLATVLLLVFAGIVFTRTMFVLRV